MSTPTQSQPDETPATTPPEAGGAAAEVAGGDESRKPPVPWWHFHRRMYDWVLSLAHHKHASTSLFVLSFAESSFFPIPPDVLQIALTVERRAKAWWYAGVSTAGSVLGGVAGYLIGMWGWETVGPFFFEYVPKFTPENFAYVQGKYEEFALLTILTAAFTPIPYKVITVTAGVFGVPLWVLVVGSLLGRGGRFYMVGAIIWLFGAPAKRLVEKYFNLLTILFVALLIGGFVLIERVAGSHGDESDPGHENGAVTRVEE
ncbi:FIG139438: lipoprotein B [hydrothermal vent metagenome]|uniref:FIG139438: lipoprotein B n=1 Tax=hydrothermal vent metagenome TaxID=652676 RepID=A0A3B1DSS1_9ZZZZ